MFTLNEALKIAGLPLKEANVVIKTVQGGEKQELTYKVPENVKPELFRRFMDVYWNGLPNGGASAEKGMELFFIELAKQRGEKGVVTYNVADLGRAQKAVKKAAENNDFV